MRKRFQKLSDSLVERLVPKADASAAVQCWIEETCRQGPLQICGSTSRWGYWTYEVCADGTRTWKGVRCAYCNG
ncbi:hypothetical protein ABT354_24160 [Streptomyces sp. NPDC000594]|uniref:hypothetical protein n=1 Tax=Streptomyces sp. NPDC000594 TaxID=3154261 RepID=UPI00331C3510